MGKSKKPDPEPESDKIMRKLGENLSIEVTEAEKRYRNKNGPDDMSQLNKDKLKCTVCAKSLTDLLKKANEPYVHMLLNVLMCRDCSTFYGDGYFSVDEDGDDKYCRWCGQGGTLYLCSSCTCAFCKKCIKQNLSRQDVKDLESDDWKCLICKPKPLFECRTVCWFLQENYKKSEEMEEEEQKETRDSRRTSYSNDEKRGSKRKASDEAVERKSKRRKSTDSVKESSRRTSNSNNLNSERKSRRQLTKELEESEEEKEKSTRKTERSSRRNSKPEKESTPISVSKDVTKKSTKVEEIIISDDDEKESSPSPKSVPNKNSRKDNSKKESSKKAKPIDIVETRPKRSASKKEIKSPETPIKNPKSDQKMSRSTPVKKEQPKSDAKLVDSVKRSSRSKKKDVSNQEEHGEDNKVVESGLQLVSLDDDNSTSETDSKRTVGRNKSKNSTSLKIPKLSLSKKANKIVVEASGYVNSAINDVLELTVLISNRCEKLSSRTVESDEDVFNAYIKAKQLMRGVHTNLDLVEEGLTKKINSWKIAHAIDITKPEESSEAQIELSDKAEIKNTNKTDNDEETSSSPNKTDNNEGTSTKPPNNEKEDVIEASPRISPDTEMDRVQTLSSNSPNKEKKENESSNKEETTLRNSPNKEPEQFINCSSNSPNKEGVRIETSSNQEEMSTTNSPNKETGESNLCSSNLPNKEDVRIETSSNQEEMSTTNSPNKETEESKLCSSNSPNKEDERIETSSSQEAMSTTNSPNKETEESKLCSSNSPNKEDERIETSSSQEAMSTTNSPNRETEESKMIPSNLPNKEEGELEETSSSKEEIKDNLRTDESMEVDDFETEQEMKQDIIDEGEPKDNKKDDFETEPEVKQGDEIDEREPTDKIEDGMEIDNECENNSMSSLTNISELEEQNDKHETKDICEHKLTGCDTQSDAINEHIDSSNSTGYDGSVQKNASDDDSRASKSNVESFEREGETNNGLEEANDNVEINESDKTEKNIDEEESYERNVSGDEEPDCSMIPGKENCVKEDDNGINTDKDVNSDILVRDTEKSNSDKLSPKNKNGPTSCDSTTAVAKCILQEEGKKEEVHNEKEEAQENESELQLKQSSTEAVKSLQDNGQVSPVKQIQNTSGLKNTPVGSVVQTKGKGESSLSQQKKKDLRDEDVSHSEENKISSKSHQQSEHDSSRNSGDRDRHRWSGERSGGWDNRGRGHNWNRDHSQDRRQSGRGGSPWNHYDNRRPNRGGWGWKR